MVADVAGGLTSSCASRSRCGDAAASARAAAQDHRSRRQRARHAVWEEVAAQHRLHLDSDADRMTLTLDRVSLEIGPDPLATGGGAGWVVALVRWRCWQLHLAAAHARRATPPPGDRGRGAGAPLHCERPRVGAGGRDHRRRGVPR